MKKLLYLNKRKKAENQDINTKDMAGYREIKKQIEKKEQKLAQANTQTKKLDNAGKDINVILDNLKPTKLNKNNMVISHEDVDRIKKFTDDVQDVTQTVRSVNDLNMAIRDFEHSSFEIDKENRSLKYELELKDNEIENLKSELSTKDKIIGKLQSEKDKLKEELNKFKGFWRSLMKHFQNKIGFDKDENYKNVSEDLYRKGIFDDNDREIAKDPRRKILTNEELEEIRVKKRKNRHDFNLN